MKRSLARTTATGIGLLTTTAGTALAHAGDGAWGPGQMWGDGHMMDGWMGGWVWGWWGLVLVLLIGLLVAAVILAGRHNDRDDALATLRERYARGEIDDEEFEERRGTLE